MIMSHTPTHMTPNILLRIQLRIVRRRPFQLDLMFVFLQQVLDCLGFVCFVVINKQDHLAFWMRRQVVSSRDGCQQASESNIVVATMDYMHRLARDWTDSTPVPAFRGSLAGCQDHTLLSSSCPTARDGRKCTNFSRVCEQDNEIWTCSGHQFSDLFFSLLPTRDPA